MAQRDAMGHDLTNHAPTFGLQGRAEHPERKRALGEAAMLHKILELIQAGGLGAVRPMPNRTRPLVLPAATDGLRETVDACGSGQMPSGESLRYQIAQVREWIQRGDTSAARLRRLRDAAAVFEAYGINPLLLGQKGPPA